MNADPRYTPVEETLPAMLPSLTRVEAGRAAAKLVKHFGTVAMGPATQRKAIPLPPRYYHWPRRCWVAVKPTPGHHKGWGRMIHDVSHYVFAMRNPDARPHHNLHARLEHQMAAYVVAQGWLSGTLAPPVKAKPTVDDEIQKLQDRRKRWVAKANRAATALQKLDRAIKYRLAKL